MSGPAYLQGSTELSGLGTMHGTLLVFRSHWAGPVWDSNVNTTPPVAGSLRLRTLKHSGKTCHISFPSPWATHWPFILAHWPLANLCYWSPDSLCQSPRDWELPQLFSGSRKLSSQHWWQLSSPSLLIYL